MSIRLSKVTKDLNVGLQTVVDFLNKKGFKIEANPNYKITEEEYMLLVKEFNKDMSLKLESERLSQERQKEKQKDTEPEQPSVSPAVEFKEIKTELPEELRPKIKSLGKIDLSTVGNRPKPQVPEPVEVKEEPKVEEVVVPEIEVQVEIEPEKAPVVVEEKPTPVQVEIPKPIVEPAPKEAIETIPQEKSPEVSKPIPTPQPVIVAPVVDESKEIAENTAESSTKKDEIFTLGVNRIESTINVVGHIDLSTINQQTRPKKKTKEEKRRERDEKDKAREEQKKINKEQQIKELKKVDNQLTKSKGPENPAVSADDKKKKRARINREKVDVNDRRNTIPHSGGQQPNRPGGQNAGKPGNLYRKPLAKAEVSEEDVQKQIKETLARLTNKQGKQKGVKYRKDKRESFVSRQQEQMEMDAIESGIIKITEFVTVNDLATMMNVPVNQVIATCMSVGLMVSINMRLDAETINLVAEEFGFKTQYVSAEVVEAINEEMDKDEDLKSRSPIVTIMGHVDHGKTSLLDYIRKTNVIAGEAGGITQHIGAYHVDLGNGKKITFLDTPGHEAFTAMRARGAKVTDIAIIIVAADDSVMPQTVEAINHAAAAGVPIVFAINKIDKPGANPEKIKEALANMNYLVEDWGGKYQSQEISAKKGMGIEELLEKILLEAELLDLKANPNKRATGSVIESSLDKGRGYVATVLVHNGTLKIGDTVLAGTHYGKIKAMFNERNQRMYEAGPAEPVQILGLNGAPQAGDAFNVMETDQEARSIATKREQLQREQGIRTQKHLTLEDIGRRIAIGNFQELNVIVKGDVDGSVEATADSLIKLSTESIQVNVIHKAVGQISESDVTLAAASNAIIIGFQVRPSMGARRLAEKEEVEIRLYSVIYKAIEEVKAAMEGMLAPDVKEEITATIEIRETFKITKVGTIAGCMVKEGKVKRNAKVRVVRDGIVVYSGELESLKRFKDDVKEVSSGYECGLNIANFNDIKVGDIIEAYEEIEVKKTL